MFWSCARGRGFSAEIHKIGYDIQVYQNFPLNKQLNWKKMQTALAHWLKSLSKPCGLMVCNDDRGRHVIEACKLAGVHVPTEIAILGVDNDDLI